MIPCDGAEGFNSFSGIDHTCILSSDKLSNSVLLTFKHFNILYNVNVEAKFLLI